MTLVQAWAAPKAVMETGRSMAAALATLTGMEGGGVGLAGWRNNNNTPATIRMASAPRPAKIQFLRVRALVWNCVCRCAVGV